MNNVNNPFNAPVYHTEICESTMEEAAALVRKGGVEQGTVIMADFQTKGRGRLAERLWESAPALNLTFSVIFKYPRFEEIPPGFTLQTGLVVAAAIEDTAPPLAGKIAVKWPNDIMINGRKAAGILTESDGNHVISGIGVNVLQRDFCASKHATSILAEAEKTQGWDAAEGAIVDMRLTLLENILARFFYDIKKDMSWLDMLCEKLYLKGRKARFIEGRAGSGNIMNGTVLGVDTDCSLLLLCEGEAEPRHFVSGEIALLPD